MPFDPNCLRNTREQFVLKNIEGFQVNEYMGRSNWVRHEFKNYRDAIRKQQILFITIEAINELNQTIN